MTGGSRASSRSDRNGRNDGGSLLESKLRPPSVPDYYVSRPRLDARLDAIAERSLTLVIAPAGSGKSQLLSNWVGGSAVPHAWLSLEEIDDDPVELWTGILTALDRLAPGRGGWALELLAAREPVDRVVRALLHDLEADSAPSAVLVIDDAHHLLAPEPTASLAVFVQHLPSWLHVVLAGRWDPALPVDRLRGRGQLAEIRFDDLRFTADEARSLLAHLAPALTDDAIDGAVRRTDGWAAGIQLTALAARSSHDQHLEVPVGTAVDPLTEDYVWHEVLASGDADLVEVLLELSVVDRVNPALGTAITGRHDVRQVLLRAEARGLFVYRLGSDGWFQIHGLVRSVLRGELVNQQRHLECHARAAQWLEAAECVPEALEQWLLAELPREALRLLSANATELYNKGREAVILRTVAAIPHEVTAGDIPALIDYAVSQILVSRPQFTESVRAAVSQAAAGDAFAPQIAALQALATTMAGDWTAGQAHALRALDGLGDGWEHDVAGRYAWNIVARGIALSERWDDGDPLVATAAAQMGREPGRGLSFEGIRSLGLALAGRPVEALQIAAGIRHAAATMSILRGELDLAEAIARREIGDRERALTGLRIIADHPDELHFYRPAVAMLELALEAADHGRLDEAAHRLGSAQATLGNDRGGDLGSWVDRVATVVALSAGDVDEARRRAAAVDEPFWGPVSRARVDLATGDHGTAAATLDDASPRSVRQRVVLDLLHARAATTAALTVERVTAAVRCAAAHGLFQTVASEARGLTDALERAAWAAPEEWMHRLRLAMAATAAPLPADANGPFEPLTAREREVLVLLPSRLTLAEIARELYVSVNTLKFHLRVIYRKLGVNSRDEAAAVARSMSKVGAVSR